MTNKMYNDGADQGQGGGQRDGFWRRRRDGGCCCSSSQWTEVGPQGQVKLGSLVEGRTVGGDLAMTMTTKQNMFVGAFFFKSLC